VSADIKFCGLTRADDAAEAVALGAAFVGVIFAGGPRNLTVERAGDVLRDVPDTVRRVGVFADQSIDDIARTAVTLGLGVVQLHGASDLVRIAALRRVFHGEIWPVIRVRGGQLPVAFSDALVAGHGVLLDAFVPGALGGTGVALDWAELAEELHGMRGERRIILAGGLRAENVGQAIAILAPDVVDVSSGVESAPGIKDHDRMRAFRDAVTHASIST
jgi:phosphoribosylanthranilate isomerase